MTLIAPFLPYIVGLCGVLLGLFGVAWGHKTTQTAKAQVSAAQAGAVAQVQTEQSAEAQANQAAAQTGAAAVAARAEIDNAVAAKPADEVRNELENWTRP
jgi:xanthosine utilization system XapX-like protein